MPNETLTLISTVTVGAGGAAQIDFTSIPQSATDIYILLSSRTDRASAVDLPVWLRFNSSSTSDYTIRNLFADGVTASSSISGPNFGDANMGYVPGVNTTSNTFGNMTITIPNYSSSTASKSISADSVIENNGTYSKLSINAGIRTSTDAVSSVRIYLPSPTANFVQYSTASLYTITKGSGGATVS